MKTIRIGMIMAVIGFGIVGSVRHAFGQIITTNHGVIVITNTLTQQETIKIASGLKIGMRDEDAERYLRTNKLASSLKVGSMTGWASIYTLADGSSLHVAYNSKNISTNGWWDAHGRLRRVYLQSDSGEQPIVLTNTLSAESFGTITNSTTVEDVIALVGQPDAKVTVVPGSGILIYMFFDLDDTIMVNTDGGSRILSVKQGQASTPVTNWKTIFTRRPGS
jgi:hypothetical protein